MRLPLPFLLYTTALGLFAWAGWTVYNSLPLWDEQVHREASVQGTNTAVKALAKGKGSGQQASGTIAYGRTDWWEQFKQVNLIGKLPPKQPTAEEIAKQREAEKPKVDMTPLEEIFELVSLVYDGKEAGRGGDTHVIIRYKETAAVEPPPWWIKENTPPSNAPRVGGPRDLAAAPSTARTKRARNGRRGSAPRPAPTAMPATGSTLTGREILQKLWVDDGGDQRRAAELWPTYGHIKLVRVAPDAQSAFFVRTQPPGADGAPAPEPKEEELLKTTAEIPQDVLLALRKLQGREDERPVGPASTATANAWRDVEETTRFGNQFHIGRKDERRFQDSGDFFNNVYVDTYVSKTSNLRGVSVRSVEPKLAQSYGVQTGDVLLEINSRKISSKAQATNMVKKDYQRGVRTFSTKWLSNGQVVERVYQAPDKK